MHLSSGGGTSRALGALTSRLLRGAQKGPDCPPKRGFGQRLRGLRRTVSRPLSAGAGSRTQPGGTAVSDRSNTAVAAFSSFSPYMYSLCLLISLGCVLLQGGDTYSPSHRHNPPTHPSDIRNCRGPTDPPTTLRVPMAHPPTRNPDTYCNARCCLCTTLKRQQLNISEQSRALH
eukprot:COSAG02_NODE_8952_length_2384_cov_1.392998_2_plen_173_part_01